MVDEEKPRKKRSPRKHNSERSKSKARRTKKTDKAGRKKTRKQRKPRTRRKSSVERESKQKWHRYKSFLPTKTWNDYSDMSEFKNSFLDLPSAKVATLETASYVDPDTQQPAVLPSGRRRALIVGINYFDTEAELDGCINDVYAMKDFLTDEGFISSSENMTILIDDPENQVGKAMPTRENLLKAMEWLVHNVGPGDILFFHFSGHGAQQPDETGVEEDGLNETILPCDFMEEGTITDDMIYDIMIKNLPSGAKMISLMDCCHSGTGMDLSYNLNPKTSNWDQDVNPNFSEGDVILFAGCDDHQTSADAYNERARAPGGAMTISFIESALYYLHKSPERPNYDQFLRAVSNHIKKRGFDQTPQLSSSQQWDPSKRKFDIAGCNLENTNSKKGKLFVKRFNPKTPDFRNSPLGPMLLAAGVTVLVAGQVIDGIGGADGVGDGLEAAAGLGDLGDGLEGIGEGMEGMGEIALEGLGLVARGVAAMFGIF